ncbi:alpha/beta hydrolase, partial [Leptospira interrogans serovar Canicola]|nr:alpha/beta hydrolase [Leptospira interrogans serovar Canicola]
DKDKLFPVRSIKNAFIIKNGGHFMILNKSDEISSKLKEILEN